MMTNTMMKLKTINSLQSFRHLSSSSLQANSAAFAELLWRFRLKVATLDVRCAAQRVLEGFKRSTGRRQQKAAALVLKTNRRSVAQTRYHV